MAHFAEIRSSDNVVLRVVVVNNSDVDAAGGDYSVGAEQWVSNNIVNDLEILKQGTYPETYWKQTSFNGNARYNYASIGGTWSFENQAFINDQPYPSWSLDSNFVWTAPVAEPSTTMIGDISIGYISWDEENLRWIGYEYGNGYPEYAWNNKTSIWETTGKFGSF
jgi:hypothetical protein